MLLSYSIYFETLEFFYFLMTFFDSLYLTILKYTLLLFVSFFMSFQYWTFKMMIILIVCTYRDIAYTISLTNCIYNQLEITYMGKVTII